MKTVSLLKRASLIGILATTGLAMASCDDSGVPEVGDIACDNLDETNCALPFPSDYFRKPAAGGKPAQIDFGQALPVNDLSGERISPEPFKVSDGFPILPSITFSLPGAVLTDAPGLSTIARSVSPSALTVVIDADTGEKQAHWVEFDWTAEEVGTKVIQVKLAKVLKHSHRYIVAVRGLKDATGKVVPATRGFMALRDKTGSRIQGIQSRQAHFDSDIFPQLEKAGIPRAELQLAWDFTTVSEGNATGLLVAMRDDLMAKIGTEGPEYTVKEVKKDPDGPTELIETRIVLNVKVPNYMIPPANKGGLARVRLDASGKPVAEGTVDTEVVVQIPRTMRTQAKPGGVMQYGHGFLGSAGEANGGWLRKFASRRGFMIVAQNFEGMDENIEISWFQLLPRDGSSIPIISEHPMQGYMNQLATQRLVRGRLAKDPLFQQNGAAVYDRDKLFYHGNSQGGTNGVLMTALSQDVTRTCLGEPGIGMGAILYRANNWRDLMPAIRPGYPNPLDFVIMQDLVPVGWIRTDGGTFGPRMTDNPLPNTPKHHVLIHAALEDAQVNNDVTRVLVRTIGAKHLNPVTRDNFGITGIDSPVTDGDVYIEYDYNLAPRRATNTPVCPGDRDKPNEVPSCAKYQTVTADDPHNYPRAGEGQQNQMWDFFETGVVKQFCSGVCNLPPPP